MNVHFTVEFTADVDTEKTVLVARACRDVDLPFVPSMDMTVFDHAWNGAVGRKPDSISFWIGTGVLRVNFVDRHPAKANAVGAAVDHELRGWTVIRYG
jgi:hypothetical protein